MGESGRNAELLNHQWNLHTSRQVEASKGAVAAVTLLNSGSWIGLLTQIDKLAELGQPEKAGIVLTAWGLGALFGTLPWLCIYLNTLYLWQHDLNRNSRYYQRLINGTIIVGVAFAVTSIVCFVVGLYQASALLALVGQSR